MEIRAHVPAGEALRRILIVGLVLVTCGLMAATAQASERDRDGDGHVAERFGGDDCDDRDGNRFPGNTEVCDARHHDEDCNPETYGHRDADGDGVVDGRCCNRDRAGRLACGADCDDGNFAVQPASQVCDGTGVAICVAGGRFRKAACPRGTVCISQPNGTGVCAVRPEGYIAAPRFNTMQSDSRRPPAKQPTIRSR